MSPRTATAPLARTSGMAFEDRLLDRLVGACLVIGLLTAWALDSLDLPAPALPTTAERQAVRFELAQIPPRPEPVVAPEPELEPESAPELTAETVLAQAVDLPASEPEPVEPDVGASTLPEPESAPEPAPAPRRVYGVRKVYAQGLGTSAAGGAALVVKRGNTLDGRADTLTATEADLQGRLAPLSSVDRAPRPLQRRKPGYSEALRAARASGMVTARLLIDVDGSVRRVEVLRDIGHDSRELAIAAFEQFRFEPALRDGRPVAVWITHKIRFEFQE